MHRFFVSEENLQGPKVILKDQQAHQIHNVLRMRPGSRIILLDDSGLEYKVTLETVDQAEVTGTVTEKRKAITEPHVHITLYQSLLRQDKFEWVLQKCTEIGVSRFVPVISQRTVVTQVKDNKIARWQRIITEAAEQSRRGRVPELADLIPFEHAVGEVNAFDRALIPWEQATTCTLCDALEVEERKIQHLALFIGPEGGFDEHEIEAGEDAGMIPVTLGARILRAETAAVVASAITLHELERK